MGSFFDLPVKNEEAYKKIDMYNNNYTTGSLIDFAYYKENYRLIAIDLSKQTDCNKLTLLEKLKVKIME